MVKIKRHFLGYNETWWNSLVLFLTCIYYVWFSIKYRDPVYGITYLFILLGIVGTNKGNYHVILFTYVLIFV